MLRRKPTAITITSEDIAAFEEIHALHIEKLKRRKAEALAAAAGGATSDDKTRAENNTDQEMGAADDAQNGAPGDMVDPSDELKPLPGDKARIVRTREERIVGAGRRRP